MSMFQMLKKVRYGLLYTTVALGAIFSVVQAAAAEPIMEVSGGVLFNPTSTIANGATFDYGTVDKDSVTYAAFRITNTGNAPLHIVGAPTLSGPNAGEFAFVSKPTSTIAAGASSNFYVSITPSSMGAKNAVITIANDDSNDNPFIINITATSSNVTSTVYEDAEDGTTKRWRAYDEIGQPLTVTNVADDQVHNRAIEIVVTDYNRQDFILKNKDGVSPWSNSTMKVLSFDLKTTNDVNIFAQVRASNGNTYYLSYSFDGANIGLVNNRYAYIHLDPALKDGSWHTIVRDLQADINAFLPTTSIAWVDGFQVGSAGARLDNILLTKTPFNAHQISGKLTDVNNNPVANEKVTITPFGESTLTDANGFYAFPGLADGTYRVEPVSQKYVFSPTSSVVVVAGANAVANFTALDKTTIVYEDAEDGSVMRWKASLGGKAGTIMNTFDNGSQSKVIAINLSDINGQNYTLESSDGNTDWHNTQSKILQFDMKTNSETYLYAKVVTQNNTYYLMYSFNFTPGLIINKYASINLSAGLKDGAWHTVVRDLQADLNTLVPNEQIVSVENFMVAGTDVRLDNVLLTNQKSQLKVSGTVTDLNNQPVSGLVVSLEPGQGTVTTDQNGAYSFTGLTNGSYTLSANASQDYELVPQQTMVTVNGASVVQNLTASLVTAFVYEDAEDGSAMRWHLLGAQTPGTSVQNMNDDVAHGKAIEIATPDIQSQDYVLYSGNQSDWHNTKASILRFDIKTQNEVYAYAKVSTQNGVYYLMYSFNFPTGLSMNKYASVRLNSTLKDGAWHTVVRDLQADLNTMVPGAQITSVDQFLFASVGARVDNIALLKSAAVHKISGVVSNGNGQPVSGVTVTVAETGATAITSGSGAYEVGTLVDGVYTVVPSLSGYTFNPASASVTLAGANGQANFVATLSGTFVYEDAQDGLTSRWQLVGANQPGTSITNIADDIAHGNVIAIANPDINSQYYTLYNHDGQSNWHNTQATKLQFDLKTQNEIYAYARVETANKTYYLMYSFNFRPGLLIDKYASINLDPGFKDGSWHTVTRDLQADLNTMVPGVPITSVEYFMIGSNDVRLDNIQLVQ